MNPVLKVAGQAISVGENNVLLINNRPPDQLIDLSGGLFKAVAYFHRYKKPKAVSGARKRKQALNASLKKYQLSFHFKKGQ